MSVDAILLAGGRGSRVGGAVKPLFEVGGSTLLAAAIDAVRAGGTGRVVVVAPVLDAALDVDWVREDPPFGGPVAAVVAALPAVDADEVYVIACDLAAPAAAVHRLTAPIPPGADGVCLDDGRRQWLIGRYRTGRCGQRHPVSPRRAAMRRCGRCSAVCPSPRSRPPRRRRATSTRGTISGEPEEEP